MRVVAREALEAAVAAWEGVVGREHVTREARDLELASTATYKTDSRHLAIVRPDSRQQVQACMRIANEHRVPVYPSSGGKNWGLGSRSAVQGEGVLLSLERMNQIVDFDEDLAVIRVQAGVTFGQVYRYLEARGSQLMLSVTGSSPEGSLIGNALERGHGFGPQADRFAHCHGPEIVLPMGDCIHGGLERFEGATAARFYKWGVGPHIDGLFAQSNLGIVTEMTFLLLPRPGDFQVVVASVASGARLGKFIDALRVVRMDDASDVQLVNRSRMVQSHQAGGVPPSRWPRSLTESGEDAWFMTCAVYAPTRAIGKARRKWIEGLIRPTADVFNVIDEPHRAWRRLARRVGLLKGQPPATSDPRRSHFMGVPAAEGLSFAYAAKPGWTKNVTDIDLDRDRVGIVWCAPVLPFAGTHMLAVARITRDVGADFGFPPDISLRPMNARTMDGVIGAVFDRDDPAADERALAWHDRLFQRLREGGYFPYRLNTRSMTALPPSREGFDHFLSDLKRQLDPNDILAPGRYDFRSALKLGSPSGREPDGS